jgi:hypothetical protein
MGALYYENGGKQWWNSGTQLFFPSPNRRRFRIFAETGPRWLMIRCNKEQNSQPCGTFQPAENDSVHDRSR